VHQARRGSHRHHRHEQRKSMSPLYPFKKNITKPLRKSARVQLRGGLGVADIENGGRTTHRRSLQCHVRSCHVHLASTRLDDTEMSDAQGKLEASHMIYLTPPIPCADQLLSMRGSKIQELGLFH
jgi:hypothetical protein